MNQTPSSPAHRMPREQAIVHIDRISAALVRIARDAAAGDAHMAASILISAYAKTLVKLSQQSDELFAIAQQLAGDAIRELTTVTVAPTRAAFLEAMQARAREHSLEAAPPLTIT